MTARRPTVVTSDVAAETVAAALWEHANRVTAGPHTATVAASARLCRRTAHELLDLHGIDHAAVLVDVPAPGPEQEQYR